jgi:hypothetical protein
MHTGSENFVRPSVGSWLTYGLGTESEDLPGFITIDPISHNGGAQNYGSSFLPATIQGTRLSGGSRGVPNIANHHLAAGDQRRQLDFVQQMNRRMLAQPESNLRARVPMQPGAANLRHVGRTTTRPRRTASTTATSRSARLPLAPGSSKGCGYSTHQRRLDHHSRRFAGR